MSDPFTEYGKLSKARAYAIKSNPINIRKGKINGYLGGRNNKNGIKIGGSFVKNCQKALSYSGNDIFSYQYSEGVFSLNAFLPDESFWPEIKIVESSLTASIRGFWDIEFKTNWVKFRK